jgi:hypothetical protein
MISLVSQSACAVRFFSYDANDLRRLLISTDCGKYKTAIRKEKQGIGALKKSKMDIV